MENDPMSTDTTGAVAGGDQDGGGGGDGDDVGDADFLQGIFDEAIGLDDDIADSINCYPSVDDYEDSRCVFVPDEEKLYPSVNIASWQQSGL